MKPAAAFQKNRAIICGTLGLAFMFGGIWLGDKQLTGYVGASSGIIIMRTFTIIIYLAFFAICFAFRKSKRARLIPFFGVCSLFGIVAFALGAAIIFSQPAAVDYSDASAIGLAGLFLTKIIGAPLSVGLICVFALLGREYMIRMSLGGMLGAFVLYTSGNALCQSGTVSVVSATIIAGVLLICACLLGVLGMTATPEGKTSEPAFSSTTSGVIKRPWRKVITPGIVIMVVFSSMMLGLLRNGVQAGDPHSSPVAMAVFVLLIAVSLLWKGLRIEHLFYAALLCSAAGFLLYPLLDTFIPSAAAFLYGVGTALFEVVTWVLVAWAVRNCLETLMTAVALRTATTIGHFLGTGIMVVGLLVSSSPQMVFESSALFLMFIYIILLLILLKFPSLQAPFMTPTDATGYSESSAVVAAEKAVADAEASGEDAASLDDLEYRYWECPCDTIAATYHLTTREREVLELLARGRNLAAMEEKLVISNNTLKMHIRHIYTKLDIHSKQDVINMVEQLRA